MTDKFICPVCSQSYSEIFTFNSKIFCDTCLKTAMQIEILVQKKCWICHSSFQINQKLLDCICNNCKNSTISSADYCKEIQKFLEFLDPIVKEDHYYSFSSIFPTTVVKSFKNFHVALQIFNSQYPKWKDVSPVVEMIIFICTKIFNYVTHRTDLNVSPKHSDRVFLENSVFNFQTEMEIFFNFVDYLNNSEFLCEDINFIKSISDPKALIFWGFLSTLHNGKPLTFITFMKALSSFNEIDVLFYHNIRAIVGKTPSLNSFAKFIVMIRPWDNINENFTKLAQICRIHLEKNFCKQENSELDKQTLNYDLHLAKSCCCLTKSNNPLYEYSFYYKNHDHQDLEVKRAIHISFNLDGIGNSSVIATERQDSAKNLIEFVQKFGPTNFKPCCIIHETFDKLSLSAENSLLKFHESKQILLNEMETTPNFIHTMMISKTFSEKNLSSSNAQPLNKFGILCICNGYLSFTQHGYGKTTTKIPFDQIKKLDFWKLQFTMDGKNQDEMELVTFEFTDFIIEKIIRTIVWSYLYSDY